MPAIISRNNFYHRYASIILALSVVFFTGCTSSSPSHTIVLHPTHNKRIPLSPPTTIEKSIISKIENSYKMWKGTPYKYGGTGRGGIDCSALSTILYREVFGRSLPRTTAAQLHSGSKVEKRNLNPGDLIFFKINGKVSHVGIYVFNGIFIHASTSKGVIKSNLGNPYWAAHYHSSRTHWL